MLPPQYSCYDNDNKNRKKKRNKLRPSTATPSNYMMPTQSERLRQLSSPLRGSYRQQRRHRSVSQIKVSLVKKSPAHKVSSTLLFPSKHGKASGETGTRSSRCEQTTHQPAVVRATKGKTLDDIMAFYDIIDMDSENERDILQWNVETNSSLSTEFHLSSPAAPITTRKEKLDHSHQDSPTKYISTDTDPDFDTAKESSSFSTAQLVRQCAHCKVLYQFTHTCSTIDLVRVARPRTAPSGRPSHNRNVNAYPRRGDGVNTKDDIPRRRSTEFHSRPLSSSGICRTNNLVGSFSRNRQIRRPSSVNVSSNTAAYVEAEVNPVPCSIADSLFHNGVKTMNEAKSNITQYDYDAICFSSRLPKSASSIKRRSSRNSSTE